MLLRDILAGIDHRSNCAFEGVDIKNIRLNSKDIKKGDLFVALRGEKRDGHDFVEDAFRKGAAASIVDKDIPNEVNLRSVASGCRHFGIPSNLLVINVKDTRKALSRLVNNFYGYPSRSLTTIGITGTNGKTTTCYLIASILEQAGFKVTTIGTINYRVGNRVYPSSLTTPDAIVINDILKRATREGIEYAVMEVSSHSLEQRRVDCVDFDIAVFTNLTQEHLDYHKDIERYFKSKMKLFKLLKPNGAAILNSDEPKSKRIKKELKRSVVTYGLDKNSDFYAVIEVLNLEGSVFSVCGHGIKIKIRTKLIGRHNVYNILASVAACAALKIEPEFIKRGIESLRSVPGRLQTIDCGQPFKVFIDFAHTPDALLNVLSLLKSVKEKKIITVFGCGGDRDRTKRPVMGRIAVSLSDAAIITADNPRSEDLKQIMRDIEKGIDKKRYKYNVIFDRKKAIGTALELANKGDIVLIAGKGHETAQIIGDKSIYFNDAEAAKEILCSRLKI